MSIYQPYVTRVVFFNIIIRVESVFILLIFQYYV